MSIATVSRSDSERIAPSKPVEGIHAWVLPRPDTASAAGTTEYNHWLGLLSTDELERASRFRFARHATEFVANRGRLRVLLGQYVGEAPERLSFVYGPQGKPALPAKYGEFFFNLSHTDGLALIAVSGAGRVGVDVEALDRADNCASDALEIARNALSAKELDELASYGDPVERQHAFLRCWTRKEAFLKALGDGLSRPLSSFSVSCGARDAALVECTWDAQATGSWRLQHLEPAPGYVAAIAWEERDASIRIFPWHAWVEVAAGPRRLGEDG